MTRILLVLVLLAVAPSAAHAGKPAPFDSLVYAPFDTAATGSIEGKALFKTQGGDVKYAVLEEVYLDPVTPHVESIFRNEEKLISGVFGALFKGTMLEAASEKSRYEYVDDRAIARRRSTTTDDEGRYRFDDVPAGDYFLGCLVLWERVDRPSGRDRGSDELARESSGKAGGWVVARVKVAPGKTTQAMLHELTMFKTKK